GATSCVQCGCIRTPIAPTLIILLCKFQTLVYVICLQRIRRQTRYTLFPYTTLFRSEKEIRRKFSDLENEFSNTSHELEEFQERMQRTNKFFYPTLYGAFIAIVGFIVLFLLEGIIGSLFGDSYYPMIATKVEQSTGFNTFMWYLAYLAPYAVITITILAILKLFIKKGRNYL